MKREGWEQVVARIILMSLVVAVAGCASMMNTPAQDLAWDRWKLCDRFPTVTLKDIKVNGDLWVWTYYGTDYAAWQACERAARAEQVRTGKLAAAAMPAVSADDAKGLVKFAYFTDQPPAVGTFLHTTFGRNMPPDVKVFPAGSRVTFFYAINQVGRVMTTKANWIAPSGTVTKTQDQTVNQMGRPGTWTWLTQNAGAELTDGGRWVVELLIDGHPVGTYEFVVKSDR
jgi:hypothetical protein